MNILFINANLHGHINPTLGLVKKLVDDGNQVNYFCSEPFSKEVIKAGGNWIGYSEKLEQFLGTYRPTDRHPFYMLMEYMLLYDEVVLPDLLQFIEKEQYDFIICDSYFGAAAFLQRMTSIPVICSHSSFAMSHTPVPDRMLVLGFHPQLDHCYQIVKRICDKYQITEPSLTEILISKGDLNIVYTTHSFNGDENINEPEYLFNGPSIDRVPEAEAIDFSDFTDRKIVYISLGSVNTDFIGFYKMCMEALKDTDYIVYMSIGRKCEISQLGDVPSNFIVNNFLPQLDILSHADAFVTHAGFNSVNEAMYFGVPMLALPLVNDQQMVAKHLTAMHLGLSENMKELSEDILKSKIETLILDGEIKRSCQKMSEEMKKTAKLEQTVGKLKEYVYARKAEDVNGFKE